MEVSGAVKHDVQNDPRTEEKRGHNTGTCPVQGSRSVLKYCYEPSTSCQVEVGGWVKAALTIKKVLCQALALLATKVKLRESHFNLTRGSSELAGRDRVRHTVANNGRPFSFLYSCLPFLRWHLLFPCLPLLPVRLLPHPLQNTLLTCLSRAT